jgi:prophage regulatory protein
MVKKKMAHSADQLFCFQNTQKTEQQPIRIERKPAVLIRIGMSHATLYRRIGEGLFPPGVTLGKRSVGWLSHEVDTMLNAFASGKTKEELQSVVKILIENRRR